VTEPTTAAEPAEDARVLLVDDDATSLAVLRRTLEGRGYHLFATRSGEQAIEVARRARPLLVLMDVMMPGVDGYEACRRLKADPATRDAAVLFLSSLDDARDKVRGLEVGAVDFITKPFQAEEVVARVHAHLTIARLRRQLEARNADLARELAVAEELLADARRRAEGPLVGSSPAVRALRESIAAEAGRAEPLLLTGSPGSGVEASARAIHHASPRAAQAFLHVNCGLLSGSRDAGLLPGPGTGGGAPRLSLLEVAERGTLFLEEVQRLPAEEQERLAAVIEAAEAAREKGAVPAPDVRVLASSSGALEASAGFHPRLLARLEARQLRVPALAERAEDVPELAQFFVRQHARRVGSVAERVSEASVRRLQRYRWPGGVRELSSLLERAVASARGPVVEIDPGLLDEGLPLGSYRLLEKLGAGGMGEVWRARHQLLARPCAVKLVRPELLGETGREQALERFGREARTIARLGSPHTVRLYDFGVSETGNPYFVMELLDGLDLHSLVTRHGPLPPGRVVAVLRQVCRSLAEAHQAGLLHRDVKPQNVLLCRLGIECDVAKVLDFGLAKSIRGDDAQITGDGAVTGTPAYMPPERVVGEPADERSDLYSLGCVAYFLLTGRPVFTGEPMAVMIHHVRSTPAPPSAVSGSRIPEALEAVVLECLRKDPASRPASALDLWRRLGEVPLPPEERWTRERAEAWWREHAPAPPSPADSDSGDRLDRPAS
jgi:DNA-binding NtrC family response regulator